MNERNMGRVQKPLLRDRHSPQVLLTFNKTIVVVIDLFNHTVK